MSTGEEKVDGGPQPEDGGSSIASAAADISVGNPNTDPGTDASGGAKAGRNPLYDGLSDFSELLTKALGSIDSNVDHLKGSQQDTVQMLRELRTRIDVQELKLTNLSAESDAQRSKVEFAMRNITALQKNVDSQLTDVSKQMHKELVSQRSSMKMDINSLKGSVNRSMSEALSLIDSAKFFNASSLPAYDPKLNTQESITFLVDRLGKLEEAMGLQQSVNQHLNNSVNDNAVIQKVYDSLFDQISALEEELNEARKGNEDLSKKHSDELKRMRESQSNLQRQMSMMTGALCSKQKLKQFKREVARDREEVHYHRHVHQHINSRDDRDELQLLEGVAEGKEDHEDGEEGAGESAAAGAGGEQGASKKVRRRTYDPEYSDQPAGEDRPTSNTRRRSAKQRRHSARRSFDDKSAAAGVEAAGGATGGEETFDEAAVERRGSAKKSSQQRRRSADRQRRGRSSKQEIEQADGEGADGDDTAAGADDDDENDFGSDVDLDFDDDDDIDGKGGRVRQVGRDRKSTRHSQKNPRDPSHRSTKSQSRRTTSRSRPLKRSTEGEGTNASAEAEDGADEVAEEELDGDTERVEVSRSKKVVGKAVSLAKSKPSINTGRKPSREPRKTFSSSSSVRSVGSGDEGAAAGDPALAAARSAAALGVDGSANDSASEEKVNEDPTDGAGGDAEGEEEEGGGADMGSLEDGSSMLDASYDDFSGDGYDQDDQDDQDDLGSSMYESSMDFDSDDRLADAVQSSKDAHRRVDSLEKDLARKMSGLEDSIVALKRVTLRVEDLRTNQDALHSRLDKVSSSGDGFEEQRNKALFDRIAALKTIWTNVHGEMLFGLERLAENDDESEATGERGAEEQSKLFISKALELVQILDNTLESFNPRDTIEQTLEKLHPALDSIYKHAQLLNSMDDAARTNDTLDKSFDDLICTDLTPSLKRHILKALRSSVPVLDESIAKVSMKHRLDKLEYVVDHKANAHHVNNLEADVKASLGGKVDAAEFHQVVGRLATAAELQKLHAYVTEQLTSVLAGSGGAGGLARSASTESYPAPRVDLETADLTVNPDYRHLLERFDLLGRHMQELQTYCSQFVPREEVHEAMKAVVTEVKALKKSSVTHSIFREGLKMKADTVEVDRLVKNITDAVGDLNFATRSLDDPSMAAAMHAKCLVCDKPITSQRTRTAYKGARQGVGSMQSMSQSTPMLGYDKHSDPAAGGKSTQQQPSLFGRVTSADPAVSQSEKVKVATELAIVRSSIDPLPDINDSPGNSPRGGPASNINGGNNNAYKQRIRSSAGGGVGPAYKRDTR